MSPISRFKSRIFGSLCALFCSGALLAVTNDTGPLGAKATGMATPDAETLSKMQLLDVPTPVTATARARKLNPNQRKAKFRPLWLKSRAISNQIAELKKSGKWDAQKSAETSRELKAILDKHQLLKESDCIKLDDSKRLQLKTELDLLETRLKAELTKP